MDNPPPQALHADATNLDEDRATGNWVDDELYNGTISFTPIASVLHPLNSGDAWFFCGNRYALVRDFESRDKLLWPPMAIINSWSSLSKAGFACGVDAVLHNVNKRQEMFFFSGNRYAHVDTMPGMDNKDYIIKGPLAITDGWASLKSASFTAINAVLENPANKEEAWFFSGERYVRVSWRPGQSDDVVVEGPRAIVDGWASLKRAGFKTVDSMLSNPINSQEAWAFSGDKYARINVRDNTLVSGPKSISDNWPSLHKAGFY